MSLKIINLIVYLSKQINFNLKYMNELEKLAKKIKAIEKRNSIVETNKDWETSLTRRLVIALLTYLVVVLFFKTMHLPKPLINAIVPTMGFLLSTLSVSLVRNIWLKYHNKQKIYEQNE